MMAGPAAVAGTALSLAVAPSGVISKKRAGQKRKLRNAAAHTLEATMTPSAGCLEALLNGVTKARTHVRQSSGSCWDLENRLKEGLRVRDGRDAMVEPDRSHCGTPDAGR
jgi:hypothetical protein